MSDGHSQIQISIDTTGLSHAIQQVGEAMRQFAAAFPTSLNSEDDLAAEARALPDGDSAPADTED